MASRAKVAILADFPWSFFDQGAIGRGGGQACTWLTQLADQYAQVSGFEFHWVTLDRSRSLGRIRRHWWQGQRFCSIPSGRLRIDLALGYAMSRFLLTRELRKCRPQLVHCWGTERSYPVVCSKLRVPCILSMQGVLTAYSRIGAFDDSRTWKRMVRWEPRFLRAATVVTCESQWGIDRVRDICPEVDARQVEYGVHPSFYRLPWKPDHGEPYAIFSGSIDKRKGVDLLLDAWLRVSEPAWRLKVAGDGPQRRSLESQNIPGIEWLGLLNWDELQRELSQASCLVLPTKADTSPNVAKEARVIGLPVITTRFGGQAGYIRDGENGIIVDPLDAVNLAAAIARVMKDPELARRLGATRHVEDREYFRPENTARGFLEIYNELLNP